VDKDNVIECAILSGMMHVLKINIF